MNESCRNQEHMRLTNSECLCNPPDVHLPQGPVLLTAHLHHQPGHGHVYWHTWHVARGTCRRPGWRRSCRAPRWRCRGRAARCSCPRTTWCPGRGTLSTCPPSDPSSPSIGSCPGWLVFDNLKIVYVKGSASDQNRCTATRPTCQARSMVSRRPGEILLKHSCRSAHLRLDSVDTGLVPQID